MTRSWREIRAELISSGKVTEESIARAKAKLLADIEAWKSGDRSRWSEGPCAKCLGESLLHRKGWLEIQHGGTIRLGKRLMYCPPHRLSVPWGLRGGRGGDEYCNPSVWAQLPLLGELVVFYRPGRMRDRHSGGFCEDCVASFREAGMSEAQIWQAWQDSVGSDYAGG